MNLISCDNCGSVLDKDKLPWPEEIYKYNGNNYEIDGSKAAWDGEDFVAKVLCPLCKNELLETDQ